jgi:broad specificity phosphatase PhoE
LAARQPPIVLAPPIITPCVQERNGHIVAFTAANGERVGLSQDELDRDSRAGKLNGWFFHRGVHGGETELDVQLRIERLVQMLASRGVAEQYDTVVIVSHAACIRVAVRCEERERERERERDQYC